MNEKQNYARPSIAQIEEELKRLSALKKRKQTASWIMMAFIVIVALIVLAVMLWLPTVRVTGTSMAPTLMEDEVVYILRGKANIAQGDLVAFDYNDKTVIKRVVGLPGDTVSVDADGYVFVNGTKLTEPYIYERFEGRVTVEFPVTVEEGSYFVLGDNRQVSMDSRSYEMGNVQSDSIIGKVFLRISPTDRFGAVE